MNQSEDDRPSKRRRTKVKTPRIPHRDDTDEREFDKAGKKVSRTNEIKHSRQTVLTFLFPTLKPAEKLPRKKAAPEQEQDGTRLEHGQEERN